MSDSKNDMRMPELLVFVRAFALGIIGTEVARIAFHVGRPLSAFIASHPAPPCLTVAGIAVCAAAALGICTYYAYKRGAHTTARRLLESRRVDLLIAFVIGITTNAAVAPALEAVHDRVQEISLLGSLVILSSLLLLLSSSIIREWLTQQDDTNRQHQFLVDEDIKSRNEDIYANADQAIAFADAVIESRTHTGLVFGIDGPWGVGKTSFVNLAQEHWMERESGSVITFRFEPLRHASELNLAERFLAELSASIQRQAFVPEFKPVATRYSRMLKGKADISFLGFKLALEPANETIEELLEDIDDVLRRIGKHVIIVIDDLDRLETSAVNNVLFAVRRTFNLKRATYILCYDIEKLIGQQSDREHAREFLEKFITLKISLFVDSAAIKRFLTHDWNSDKAQPLALPSTRLVKAGSLLTELSNLLSGKHGASYMSLLGDLRKVKRFVNAALLMQIERSDLTRTDFNTTDLVNLMLLHLNYPGIFRQIHVQESDGRAGIFSVKMPSSANKQGFSNSEDFISLLEEQRGPAKFLLQQLFCVEALGLKDTQRVDDLKFRSRACFNDPQARNLESYVALMVRFEVPEPQKTYALYRDAVERVRQHKISITEVLGSSDFEIGTHGEHPHDQFWQHLVNRSYDLSRTVADDAIENLIARLPQYSVAQFAEGLRQRSIYSLALLLDRAGWGDADRQRDPEKTGPLIEIAYRIYGEKQYEGRGLIQALASPERGVAGWDDLMLLRLLCSADRGNQLRNLQSALLVHQGNLSHSIGQVYGRALDGMRPLSQAIFSLFKKAYIDPQINFLRAVDSAEDQEFLGSSGNRSSAARDQMDSATQQRLAGTRSSIKAFVIYQLSNQLPPKGSGVGCGLYDQVGTADSGEISKLMNDYMFGVCFNLELDPGNIYCFLDYCLANLSKDYFADDFGYIPTSDGLHGGLEPERLAAYWEAHKSEILGKDPTSEDRHVVTANYVASYRSGLPPVFEVLDKLLESPSEA